MQARAHAFIAGRDYQGLKNPPSFAYTEAKKRTVMPKTYFPSTRAAVKPKPREPDELDELATLADAGAADEREANTSP